MIRAATSFDDLIEHEMVGRLGEVPITTADGAPYSGLAVERYPSGEIWTITEIRDGFRTGYAVEYRRDGTVATVDEVFRERDHGLKAEWNERGDLTQAARLVEDVTTARLQIDPVTKQQRQVEAKGADDHLAKVLAALRRPSPEVPQDIRTLLDRFDGTAEALHREAALGLGLA